MKATGNDINIQVNGITICYDDLGDGDCPIIFVHGFPFDKSSWKPQMDFFKGSNRVIAYDIRGFGKSTLGDEKLSMNLFADDLILFMDALQINKAILCGLSMGGYILLNAVHRYPSRFQSIILCDTQCISDSPEARDRRYKAIELIETEGLMDFAENSMRNVFSPDSLSNKKELVNGVKNVILSTPKKTIIESLRALANRYEMCYCLRNITVPTLIICGREDGITPIIQSEFLHNRIKNSKLRIINKAGHLSNLERPREFNIYLKDFIYEPLEEGRVVRQEIKFQFHDFL